MGTIIRRMTFCSEIEIIESDYFYDIIMQYTETEKQREKVMLCKDQFEYIDATVVMPQTINKKAYILLKSDLSLEASIRKTIHELIHLVHRCIITKKMMLSDLYEIEGHYDYKLFYYLDEFLTKKKELIIYYDLLHKNKKIVDDRVYIDTMAKKFKFAKELSSNNLEFMRDELFAIAETMAYISIFPDMFPEHFIEDHANISDISRIIEILGKFDSIDVFINDTDELKTVIDMIERNF
ncbi:MAG: hypothetical protein HDQ97_06210 [Lachnospiraceae bacterium]|nr:hypothetical protein [Lachnospiraceae bacterium]